MKGDVSKIHGVVVFFMVVTITGALFTALWIYEALNLTSMIPSTTTTIILSTSPPPPPPPPKTLIPFTCPTTNHSRTICHSSPPPSPSPPLHPSHSCPSYFRWIHQDLRPWRDTGITRDMVERASNFAHFRLIILSGNLYFLRYGHCFQTRDVFTIWGILQLLRRYPGRIPDIDIMFNCDDLPLIKASDYNNNGKTAPPPLFRYCSNDSMLDIPFPDWSFWGWPEINIKPWEKQKEELKEGNKRMKWIDREPYAYWKGNHLVASTRFDLLKCNVSQNHDWNARIYSQDWFNETRTGFKESNLAKQCTHRYKIYIEGNSWSVSEKYILACDSLTLLVKPKYYDFFTRDLMPVHHYWPIRDDLKCPSIKFAVEWGNKHKQKAQAMGREASKFIQENLNMDYIYDYMFHLLNEYAKLLKYKPTRPPRAVRWCSESMACQSEGLVKQFMIESMVNISHYASPCALPPPYSPVELLMILRRKANSLKQVEKWEESVH
ncbi:putative protein xylosyltransferase [Dioscorea sansibarensis]